MTTFGLFLDRSDFRDFHPRPMDTTTFRARTYARGACGYGEPSIAVDSGGGLTIQITGSHEEIRAVLDQLELAYDRLVNPPARTHSTERAPATVRTFD